MRREWRQPVRGRFTFRPYNDARPVRSPAPSRSVIASNSIDGDEDDVADGAVYGCYYCASVFRHEHDCPKLKYVLMRPGECWTVMGSHFLVFEVDDYMVEGYLSFATYRTRFSRLQLNASVIRPYPITNCDCQGSKR